MHSDKQRLSASKAKKGKQTIKGKRMRKLQPHLGSVLSSYPESGGKNKAEGHKPREGAGLPGLLIPVCGREYRRKKKMRGESNGAV